MKMIKKTISLLVFLLLVSSVSAMFAGTSDIIINFTECTKLTIQVNGSLPIEKGEYNFTNCTETSINNTWSCDCYDGYKLIMNIGLSTINNYTINATDKWPIYGSSGSRNHRTKTIVTNTTVVNGTPIKIVPVPTPTPVIKDPTPIKEEPVVIVEEEIEVEGGLSDWMIVVIGIVGLFGVMSLIYFIYWKVKTPGSKGFDYEP